MDLFTIVPMQLDELIRRLTPRQFQVVELLAQGHDTKAICDILSIERVTLQKHIHDACQRIEIDNKMQLVVMFAVWRVTKTN